MDPGYLMLSLLLGCIGMGLAAYGKRAGRVVHITAGLLLMGVPYFIPNLIALLIVGLALTAAPFLIPS